LSLPSHINYTRDINTTGEQDMDTRMLRQAFETFMEEAFEDAVIASTKASWGGSGYSVELLDGSFRTLWNDCIGNLYDSPGIILSIPTLNSEDWNDDSPKDSFFDNTEELMVESFSECLQGLRGIEPEVTSELNTPDDM
jgi:hypothetical protein